MPDPLSIALGVVQVAETGFKLADTIYKYTNSVRKAEEQFRPIADYVKLTCTVLEQIASHLQDEDLTALYKPALLESAQIAIQGCEKAFDSLRVYLATLTKDRSGNGGPVSTTTRFAWNWKRKEIDNHQVHLERYKSTFDLLLSTLTFVSSSRTAKDTLVMKIELQRLMNVEAEAKRKEALLASVDYTEPRAPPGYTALSTVGSAKAINASAETQAQISSRAVGPAAVGLVNNFALATHQAPTNDSKTYSIMDSAATSTSDESDKTNIEDALLLRLNECASAMEQLSATLNDTISQWEQSRHYQRESLLPNFQILHSAIKRVSALELLDTRTTSTEKGTKPLYHGTPWFASLTRASKPSIQMSRLQHFRYEPISPPGSRPESPLSPQRSESPPRKQVATLAPPSIEPTSAILSHPKQPPKFSIGPSGDSMPPPGGRGSAGTLASTVPRTPRPQTSSAALKHAEDRMEPERAQPEPLPSEQNSLSRSNTNTRSSSRLKATMLEQLEPIEGTQTIQYIRTGRVSRANKGKRVHDCEECGKTYTRAEHLRRHQQNHKPGGFTCDVPGCGRSFFREDLLVRHKARHNDPLNPVAAVASPVSQHSDLVPVISEPLLSQPSRGQSVSTSADPESTGGSPHVLGTSTPKRPAGTHTAHSRDPFAISVNGQYHHDNIGYISGTSNNEAATVEAHEQHTAAPSQRKATPPDYYRDLGLSTSASVEDINKAYRKLALQYHPDRNPGRETEVLKRFEAVRKAHEFLTDPVKKPQYDNRRRNVALEPITSLGARTSKVKGSTQNILINERSLARRVSGTDRYSQFPAQLSVTQSQERPDQFKAWQNSRTFGANGQKPVQSSRAYSSPGRVRTASVQTHKRTAPVATAASSYGDGSNMLPKLAKSDEGGVQSGREADRQEVFDESSAMDDDLNFALLEMSETADVDFPETSSKNDNFAQEDEEQTVARPLSVGSRSHSMSDRSISRSRSRSRSRSMSPTQLGGPAGAAAVGALAGYALSEERRWESVANPFNLRKRSRSRSRAVSVDSIDERHRDPEDRNARIAQAGSASATMAGLVERVRYKSREGRGRSINRLQQGKPIGSAGLGGVALAGLYEKNRASKKVERCAIIGGLSARERSRTRSFSGREDTGDTSPGTSQSHEEETLSQRSPAPFTKPPRLGLPIASTVLDSLSAPYILRGSDLKEYNYVHDTSVANESLSAGVLDLTDVDELLNKWTLIDV